jgi:Adenylate and Guanylate cyclase catalytic domain
VAVAGVPDPRDDHAVVMAQFANDCLVKFGLLIRKLEKKLGPGTADLGLRVGLHSGSITGGILRGERSRFQLFGDTINTAARMESNSLKGRIQISEQTADLIMAANLEHWLQKREGKIEAKGKGTLQTYWLVISTKNKTGSISMSSSSDECNATHGNCSVSTKILSHQHSKLVDYNTDCLVGLLKRILARRAISQELEILPVERNVEVTTNMKSIMDDTTECIAIPDFQDDIERSKPMDADTIEIDPIVIAQLRGLLQEICRHYNSANYYHNFERATHVAM